MLPCHGRDRRFESGRVRQNIRAVITLPCPSKGRVSKQTLKQVLKFFRRNVLVGVLVIGVVSATLLGAIIIRGLSPERDRILEGVQSSPVVEETVVPSPEIDPLQSPQDLPTPKPPNEMTNDLAEEETYIVVSGDSLWSISERLYSDGNRYQELAEANQLNNPDSLVVGQQLTVKTHASAQKELDMPVIENRSEWTEVIHQHSDSKQYTIVSGDSLWKIADTQLGDPYRWTEIYQLNRDVIGDNPALIYPNTILHLPDQIPQNKLVK